MNDRERLLSPLMELIAQGLEISEKENGKFNTFKFADHLIANGVTVQKYGRWVGLEYDGYADGHPVYDLFECSVCGEEKRGEDVPETHPYCPACGARMCSEP